MVDQKYSIPVRRTESVNASANPISIDSSTRAQVSITYAHHEIHGGSSYTCQLVSESLADNASIAIAFKTPNTAKWLHLIPAFVAKAAGHLKIVENATWVASTGNTSLPVYNRNRNSLNTTGIEENTTVATFTGTGNAIANPLGLSEAGGTVIEKFYAFSDKKIGTEQRGTEELILKQDTKYSFVYKADAATNAAHIILNFYEHTNKQN